MTELVPLLRLFWPEAELRFDPETLLPTALVRAGTEEEFDILSGGTQEQSRCSSASPSHVMLAKAGTPAPIILDDAIVYTDDDRIERMFDALTRRPTICRSSSSPVVRKRFAISAAAASA